MDSNLYLSDLVRLSEQAQARFDEQLLQYHSDLAQMDRAKRHFRETGLIDPCVRPEIAQSWKRCCERGLDWSVSYPPAVEPKVLAQRQSEEAYLIGVARPVIHDILEQITAADLIGVGYVTDTNNLVLSLECPESMRQMAELAGLREGVLWTEEHVGTNSITLAMQSDSIVCTNRAEHYLDLFSIASCVTAPIHNNDGELVGSITLTYYGEFYNSILTALVKTAAQLIEKQIWSFRYNAVMDYALNNSDEGVLVLNSKFDIIQMNKAMLRTIGDPQAAPTSLDIRMLFKEICFEEIAFSEQMHTQVSETFLTYQRLTVRVRIDLYRIDTFGTADGYVITCRDIGKLISDSRKFTSPSARFNFDMIVTQNAHMRELIRQCRSLAKRDCPILLLGESGTGKEVFAQSIHNGSPRASKPFVAVNCAALPISLVESELFGYEKGTFTDGLTTGKAGKFEIANGGTIFLDEIGELPLDVQAKLLRVLDNHTITRIGGNTEKKLDIRVIAATNRDLYQCVRQKSFREDLYYRINMIAVELPPLSQRGDDVALLAEYYLRCLNTENRDVTKTFSPEYLQALREHVWRGNVRELQNIVTRAYYLCPNTTITIAQLPPGFIPIQSVEKASAAITSATVEDMEKELMERALRDCGGNVSHAAEAIHLSRSTFYRKMKSYGITIT